MSERLSIGNAEDKILKRKMVEESEAAALRKESKSSEADSGKGKMVEVVEPKQVKTPFIKPTSNLIEQDGHSSSSRNVIAQLLPQQEVKEFACSYCDKKFSNLQALGGHQNAHKNERNLKRMEQKRKDEEMDSIIRSRPNFSYPNSYSSPSHFQGYPYFRGNFQLPVPVGPQMNNVISSPLGSSSGGYGGMQMPIAPSSSLSPFFMQVPRPQVTPPYLGMTSFLGGNQTSALSIPQRPESLELRLYTQANQTPSSGEGAERDSDAEFVSHGLPIKTHNFFGGNQLLDDADGSSSSTTESTLDEIDLNLKL